MWNQLKDIDQLTKINDRSKKRPVLLFKHSIRCSISAMVLNRLERNWEETAAFDAYFLDLINYRDISDRIAAYYQVQHESPQAILVKDGVAVFSASHTAINFMEINETAAGLTKA